MAAERQPGSNRGRPALDWNQAFLYYAGLPPEQRDYAAVAAEFGVSVRTVERHGRKERWRERARELDREASRTAAARLVEERAATLTDFERLVEASLLGYAQSCARARCASMRPIFPVCTSSCASSGRSRRPNRRSRAQRRL